MKGYIYSIIASLIVGTHLFSLKLLSTDYIDYTTVLVIVIVTMFLSRYFIYLGMKYIDPTIVHLILSMSVFITFTGSVFILKNNKFNTSYFLSGITFILIGVFLILTSYQ